MLKVKFAFKCGSSKQGNALLAYVSPNCVVANSLKCILLTFDTSKLLEEVYRSVSFETLYLAK